MKRLPMTGSRSYEKVLYCSLLNHELAGDSVETHHIESLGVVADIDLCLRLSGHDGATLDKASVDGVDLQQGAACLVKVEGYGDLL